MPPKRGRGKGREGIGEYRLGRRRVEEGERCGRKG